MSASLHAWIPRPFWLPVFAIVPGLVSTLASTEDYAQQRIAAIEYVRQCGGQIRFTPLPKWWPGSAPMPEWMQSVKFIIAYSKAPFTLSRIAPLHELWGLEISCEMDPEGLQQLPRFRHLKRIIIHNRKVTDADLVYVGQCRELELLSMWQPPITNDGLRHLAALRLNYLMIEEAPISGRGLRHIAGMPLRELDLRGTSIGKGVKYLEGMPLRELNLEGTWVGDASLAVLAKLPLERLNLSHTGVTPQGLRTLLESKTLQRIYVDSRNFTADNIKELKEAGLPVQRKPSKH